MRSPFAKSAATASIARARPVRPICCQSPTKQPLAVLPAHIARIKDLAYIEGIRDNMLHRATAWSSASTAPATSSKPFSPFKTLGKHAPAHGRQHSKPNRYHSGPQHRRRFRHRHSSALLPGPGLKVDVTVSSIGDAKKPRRRHPAPHSALRFPTVTSTPWRKAPWSLAVTSAGGSANAKIVNHPNVGRIPLGALVERDSSLRSHANALPFSPSSRRRLRHRSGGRHPSSTAPSAVPRLASSTVAASKSPT